MLTKTELSEILATLKQFEHVLVGKVAIHLPEVKQRVSRGIRASKMYIEKELVRQGENKD